MGQSPEPSLYAAYLGGDPTPGRLSEDHEVVFVVASDVKSARRLARAKWLGVGSAHVDSIVEIFSVDGFDVRLSPSASGGQRLGFDHTYEPAED